MKNIFYIAHLFFFLPAGISQTMPVDSSIRTTFNQYRCAFKQEKIFIHTDKDLYGTGEILWFRMYYVDAIFNSSESISKIAYVELLDKNNLPVLQEKVSLKPGEADGSIFIPWNLPSGIYRFRTYTSWMKNFDPEYYFEKPLRIINPRHLSQDTIRDKPAYDIQFFPEGGNLVQNIETKVAFRIVNEHGTGLDCTGVLVNSNGDTILNFHPLHQGLGNFDFTPAEGQRYKAVIRFPQGEQIIKEIPATYASGYTMRVSKSAQELVTIEVRVSPDLDLQNMYLFVHGSHSYLPVKEQPVVNQATVFMINPVDLEEGISQLTLFNKYGQPVCERLYFKYPESKLSISVEMNSEFGTRKKIDLNLAARDQRRNPVSADMSLAVYRLDSLQGEVDAYDIRYYFYLTAELGPVEYPAFYFEKENAREEDMNNLMMTHGWRRYNWKNLMNPKPVHFEFPPEMLGHIVHGKLINKMGSPVNHVESYLSVPSARAQIRTTYSDEEGNVKFEMTDFYGSQQVIVQTGPAADSNLHIEITSPFSRKYSSFELPAFSVPTKNYRTLLYRSIHGQVQNVYDGAKLNKFSTLVADTNSFYVVPDEIYLLDNYTRFQTMEEVMREYVYFASVSKKNDKFQLFLANKSKVNFFREPPLILIDGVPFFDPDELFQQDPKKIKRLDLINREYVLGTRTFNGIVNAATYQGDLDGILLNPRAIILDYPGMLEKREFFSPVYETEAEISSRMPDYRTLLYWTPQIKAGENEKTRLSFYTSDLPGKYAVIVQGLTEKGVPGGQVMFFSVRK